MRLIIVALLAGAVLTCDSGPKAGELTVELVTPRLQLGAALFRVTALEPQTIDTVTAACAGCQAFVARVSDREVRGIVTGTFGAGPLFRVGVPDRGAGEAFSFALQQLAAPDFHLVSGAGSSLQLLER
jgi:hypothetical protein